MKLKTSELTGAALDWAVAQAEGNVRLQYDSREGLIVSNIIGWIPYCPSLAWQQGGPIIEREKVTLEWTGEDWMGYIWHDEEFFGPTPLIAAMRCHVASKLGDEVNVPKELH